ncbi:MAG TPA: glycosyltransferase [Caulobacteraceae bacterium]|nr:glycosyltransferase [Caulobacteraceae bacterium]
MAIVGYRNPNDVHACILALARSTHLNFSVVICENGGEPAFHALRRLLPETLPGGQPVRVLSAPDNPGYGAGVNRCLREAPDADAWWVLNPDTEPQAQAMAALARRLAHGFDAVGGVLRAPDGSIAGYGGRWRPWMARAVALGQGDRRRDAVDPARVERRQNYLSGASMMIGRRFLATTGPLREDYFLFCEEVEWCLRARARGMRLGFASEAVVLHRQGSTTGSARPVANRARGPVYLDARNQMLLTRDLWAWRLPVAAPVALMMLAAQYLRRGAWRQFTDSLAGWAAGLAGERGRPHWFAN